MSNAETAVSNPSVLLPSEVALIVGSGPGISASCARLLARSGLRVAMAARTIDKPVLQEIATQDDVRFYACDASLPVEVARLFEAVTAELGSPRLVIHNIDGRMQGIFRKAIHEAPPELAEATLLNGAFSAFLVGQQAAIRMRDHAPDEGGMKGTIIFTNASAALKGFPLSGAFAMACHAKAGLAQSMARELMPQGIHVVNVPIDGAIGWRQPDGTRAHWMAGTDKNDNQLDPDRIAELYLQLHRQHRSTWASEVVLRPWVEKW